ncbi:hypothetical protein GCM10029963_59600 [Micromonospora andamanensis]
MSSIIGSPFLTESQRAALRTAASLAQLGQVDADRLVAPVAQCGGQTGGLLGQHHVPAVAHRVETEHLSVGQGGVHGVREEPAQHGLTAGRERLRQVRHGPLVEHGQRGVQVVEARVDELHGDHRVTEDLLELGVRGVRGAETGAGEQVITGQQDIALTLVDVLRVVHLEAGGLEPGAVRGGLVGALRVPELHGHRPAVDHGAAVGGEDHVGQAGYRRDLLDGVTQVQVDLAQPLPLPDGEVDIDRGGRVHPGVDRVVDGEVRRPAHQEALAGGVHRHVSCSKRRARPATVGPRAGAVAQPYAGPTSRIHREPLHSAAERCVYHPPSGLSLRESPVGSIRWSAVPDRRAGTFGHGSPPGHVGGGEPPPDIRRGRRTAPDIRQGGEPPPLTSVCARLVNHQI